MLPVHIAGGALALVAGFAGLAAAKGERMHRRAGAAFVAAMLVMGLSGAGIAAASGEEGSVIGGLLAVYLVLSGFAIARPQTPRLRRAALRWRLASHLWRMCFALFIASGSFFLGQADEIPEAARVWPVLITLAVWPLLAIPYFVWRLRTGRSGRRPLAEAPGRPGQWTRENWGVPP